MNSEKVLVGIDEAGRGSLIGDMFVAAVAIDSGALKKIVGTGVKDSKMLSRSRRYRLLLDIVRHSKMIVVCRITPEEIDRENLNDLEVRAIERILKHMKSRGIMPARIVADEVSGREDDTRRIAESLFPSVEVHMVPRADREFVEVSAASIVAKSMRDHYVRLLSIAYGEMGSGYPSDPRTIRWLNQVWSSGSLPGCVRKSWKTIRRRLTKTLYDYVRKK